MKTTKKALSVLLVVVMLMSSMSVCFGTISFAAGGTATAEQWTTLANALANDTIKSASFTGSTNNKTVDDPDGKVIAAVEAYFAVVNAIANKAPACGNPSNDTSITGSTEGNRTINQVNTTIKNEIASRLGADYTTYNVDAFLTGLLAGANVSAGTGSQKGGRDTTNDTSAPGTNLSAISDIKITVTMASAVTGYTLDTLPDNVVTSKSFTVKHTNTNYDYSFNKETVSEGSGCNAKEVTYYSEYYYYFYNISAVSSANGASLSTQTIKDSAAVLSANADYFSKDLDALVNIFDATTLNTVKTAVTNAKSNVVNAFGASVYNHFFSAYNVENLTALIEKAVKIIEAAKIAIDLDALVDAGYADIITNKAALEALANNVKTLADKYDAYAADVKAYVESHEYEGEIFNRAAVTTFYNAVIREIELIELRELKAAIEAELGTFVGYTDEQVADRIVTGTELNYAKGKVDGWIGALNTYADANVAEVWEGEDIDAFLAAVSENLEYLITVNGYTDSFANEYAYYVSTVYGNTNIDDDSADLLAAVKAYDSWYTGLKNLVNNIEYNLDADLADRILKEMDDEMKAHLDSKYNALNTRVEAQINAAYVLFTAYVKAYGEKVNMASVSEYRAMKDSIGLIDAEIYNFLNSTANFDISDEAVAKYNAMQKQFPQYEQFLNSHGFATYEQSLIGDIVRPEADDTHDAHIGDYTVTDEKVENIIAIIEQLLADDEIKALLGNLINKDEEGNPTGEPFALGALVEGLLEDAVFTDSLINTIIQFVYPLVAKEFAKVWAGLPETMTIEDVDTGFMGIKADVTADLSLDTVEDAIAKVGVFLAPSTLAKNLENAYGKNSGEYAQYTEVISVLKSATTKAVYNLNGDGDEDDTFINPWEDANLFENVYDEVTGEQIFNEDGTPKQVYKLKWGVDEAEDKREAFLNAACAALSGLEPLLFGILTNRTQANANDSDGVPRGAKIGTGSGSAKVVINLNLEIDPITLVLKFGGNDGYDNALAPIFEALGLTNIPHGENLTTLRKILDDGLLKMIDQVIDKLDTNPVAFLLEALPNLAYALEAGLVAPLLGMLRTEISYYADAQYSVIGLINGSMPEAMKSTEPIIVDLGEMIKLEDMGLDISSFAAIWNMFADSIGNIEAPNAGYLATLGALVEKDTNRSAKLYAGGTAGKAYHINANKADVLIYLLRYVFSIAQDETSLRGLLGAFMTVEVQDTNEDGSLKFDGEKPVMIKVPDEVKIDELVSTLDDFGLFEIAPDKAIAAIVELFNQTSYDTLKDYVWYASELNEDTVVGMTPAIEQYLGYDNNWTKETATYLVENVEAIIGAVMTMVGGEDAEPFSLSATLDELIGGLFTNANITAIAKLLAKLDLNALLAGDKEEAEDETATVAEGEEGAEDEATEAPAIDVNSLVNAIAGIDLSGFAAYAELADDATWGFEDGDKAGFVAALTDLLEPLSPVLDFILAGADLELADGGVAIVGYNGYDSAIVPLLEALGATPAALAEGEDALAAVLDALVARINAIIANPVEEILNLLPSLLYFVKSNGLTTAVRNLLQPVYVILETIDPIYALNLNELINGFTKDLGITIDLGDLGFEAIFDILGAVVALDLSALEEIIDDVCEVLAIYAVDYTSASSLIGANGKKGAYSDYFDAADLLTVVVSFALSWIQEGNNANDIVALIAGDDAAKAEEIQKYITGAITIIAGIEPEYQQINWAYNFPANYEESIFESGLSIQPSIEMITYPNNWTEEAAKYVGDNLAAIADEIVSLIDIEGVKYESVADLAGSLVNIYSAETIDAIIAKVVELLEGIDAVLVDTVGLVLGADIAALKAYKAPADIDTGAEFATALAEVLATIQPVVDWLLFGKDYAFFSQNGANLVTIKGAEGYAYGLAPILEALGVNAPAKDVATVESVLTAVFARVDEILAAPVNEVFDLLPNIIYFLNANGVSVSVQNLLAGVTGLIGAVKNEFGVDIDLMAIFNDLINGLLPEGSAVTLDVANLDLASIFALVQELLGLNLAPIADTLINLCVGKITAYTSASGEYGFKMQYNDDFARYDMITIIVSCLLQILKLEDNAAKLEEMLGDEAYTAVTNILSLKENVAIQDFSWALTDKADTGEIFSAFETSLEYTGEVYGDFYTEEQAQYIAENFAEFVNNIVYLLGLDVDGNGTIETDLTGIINGLLNGNLYNSSMVVTIRDAIAGLVDKLTTEIPAGAHILEILKEAKVADLKAVAKVAVPEFTENRALFVESLCNVLEPIYPVVEWLLADTDLTFFIDEDKNNLITLPGAEGYVFGLIPVLETLECEGILAPADYYAAIDGGNADTLITSILNPLLDRVDEIIAAPADEILAMLPNIIYFINSNAVDTVVKNTLNAVYTLLNAIEPIAKIDLYELVGVDFAEINFKWLVDKALELLSDAGYTFSVADINAVAELTVGTLQSYTSLNGKQAYKMVYAPDGGIEGGKTEMVTVIERLAITFITDEKNQEALMQLFKDKLGMTEETAKYVEGLIKVIAETVADTSLGMQLALASVYYVFYGVDTGVGETVGGYDSINKAWKEALDELGKKNPAGLDIIRDILGLDIFEDVISPDKGLAPNGLIAFFQKIASWFQSIFAWFGKIFG